MPHVSEFRASDHERHEPLLVAALAAGDLAGTDRDRAAGLVTACGECSALHDDLLAIARATAVLPAAVRPRDFRIRPEQAARLRPGGWRRLVAAFAAPRLAFSRPLGVGLTTLGLAGLLVANVPAIMPFAGSGAAAPSAGQLPADQGPPAENASPAASMRIDTSAGEPGAEATRQPVGVHAGPSASAAAASAPPAQVPGAAPSVAPEPTNGPDDGRADQRDELFSISEEPAGPSPLTIGSIVAVLSGLTLLVLRRVARRFTSA